MVVAATSTLVVASPSPAAAAPVSDDVDDLPAPVRREGPRWRAGAGFGFAGSGGDATVLGGNLDVRFGRQFTAGFGTYLQARGGVFAAPSQNSAAYAGQLSWLAELTPSWPLPNDLERSVLIAVGPSLDALSLGGCSCAAEGGALGAEGRLSVGALALSASPLSGRRSNFFITITGHPSWTWKGAFQMYWGLGLSFEAF